MLKYINAVLLFQNVCRTLYCFSNAIAFHGKCVPFLGSEFPTGYKLTLKLLPTQNLSRSDMMMTDLNKYYLDIIEMLDFLYCKVCYVDIIIQKGSLGDILREVYMQLIFTKAAGCKTINIWSKFMAIERNLPLHFNLTVNGTLVSFKAFWVNKISIDPLQRKIIFREGIRSICKTFIPARGQICPKVELLNHEVQTVMKYHPKAAELMWVNRQEAFNGSSAFLCCYKYIIRHEYNFTNTLKCHTPSLITFLGILPMLLYMKGNFS